MVTSAAEALVLEFYDDIKKRMPPHARLQVKEYARLLMRHPSTKHPFAVCLQSYMATLDQSRPGRNSSYKVMSAATTARYQAFVRFTRELEAVKADLSNFYKTINDSYHFFCFSIYVVDWHGIAGQLPEVHRHFERPQDNMVRRRLRNTLADRVPWLHGRS